MKLLKSNEQYSIALITCYLGKIPWYFNLFLKSCSKNLDVNFVFISDQEVPDSLPINFKWVYMEKKEVEALICKKLKLCISLNYAYKLCDIKPAYGVIFEEYLAGYDFWGHCDIDLIFGRIRHFMNNDILDNYDVICVSKYYVTGFFTLFRNNDFINHLYEQSKDYPKIFTDSKHFCFDECNNLFTSLIKGHSIFELKSEIESMTHIVKRLDGEGKLKSYFNGHVVESLPGKMTWDHGKLIFSEKYEALLYHLIVYKSLDYHFYPFGSIIPNKFYIEEFYISQYDPNTVQGIIKKTYYKFLKKKKQISKHLYYKLESSKKIKDEHAQNFIKSFEGEYFYSLTLPPRQKTQIIYKDQSLYIKYATDQSFTLLKHLSDNVFYSANKSLEIKLNKDQYSNRLVIDGTHLYRNKKSREYKL